MQCLTRFDLYQLATVFKLLETTDLSIGIVTTDFKEFYRILFGVLYIAESKSKYSLNIYILDKCTQLVSKGSTPIDIPSPELIIQPERVLNYKLFHHVALGGTFDHTHNGHVLLLYTACYLSNKVTIGLAEHPKKKHLELFWSFNKRKENIEAITSHCTVNELNIVPLHDNYGPTSTDDSIDAVIASIETKTNTLQINTERRKNNLKDVCIVLIDTLPDTVHGGKLSSSKIRESIANSNK